MTEFAVVVTDDVDGLSQVFDVVTNKTAEIAMADLHALFALKSDEYAPSDVLFALIHRELIIDSIAAVELAHNRGMVFQIKEEC